MRKSLIILFIFSFISIYSFSQTKKASVLEKYYAYELHKSQTNVPFLLNFFLGFGLGSFIQGDSYGGTVALSGDLVSASFLGLGIILMKTTDTNNVLNKVKLTGLVLTIFGASSLLLFKFYQLARPFAYAEIENLRLKYTMGILVGLSPIFDFDYSFDEGINFKLGFKKILT